VILFLLADILSGDDIIDQTRDIVSALNYLTGEPGVDISRIGIWGTSYSGGHVIYVAAQDQRIAAIYSQVGFHGIGLNNRRSLSSKRAIQKARGEIAPIPIGIDNISNLKGSPDFAKILGYMPIDWANKILVPTLIVDVESEELFDRKKNVKLFMILLKKMLKQSIKFFLVHIMTYIISILNASNKLALDWFIKHLKLNKKGKGD